MQQHFWKPKHDKWSLVTVRILRSCQDLIKIYQPQNTWSSEYHLLVPFALHVADIADVPVFHSAASALLSRVSKQKRFQLFSFGMWPYIIPVLASVTPPSLLRNRTIYCGNARVFSKWPNEVLHSLEARRSHGNSTCDFLFLCLYLKFHPTSLPLSLLCLL